MTQLPLPFVHRPQYDPAEFLHGPCSEAAAAWLARPATWPEGRLVLWGEAGSGKTHLAHVWVREAAPRGGACLLAGRDLAWPGALEGIGPIGVDDADRAPETTLLHVLNAAAELGRPVMLTARLPPARWQVGLADLASRLRAAGAVQLLGAADELLAPLLARLLAERQVAVPPGVQSWLLLRLPRTPAALALAADRMDRHMLATGGRVTRAAAAVVDELSAPCHAELLEGGA